MTDIIVISALVQKMGGDIIDFLCKIEGKEPGTVIKELREQYLTTKDRKDSYSKKNSLLRKHTYDSAIPQYQKHVFKKPDKSKFVVYWTQDKEGNFSIKGLNSDRVWYNQKALKQLGIVFIVEGEKDVETITRHGYIAITAGSVSDTPTPEMCKLLTGRDIVIIPDNDKLGKDYAQKLYSLLSDIAKSIRIVEITGVWSEAHDKADISDMPEDLRLFFLKGIIEGKSFETENFTIKDNDLFPAIPFPQEALHKGLRAFCNELSSAFNIETEIVYTNVLTILSSSIGNTTRFYIDSVRSQPAFLWSAIVADSGSGKSDVQSYLMKPIEALQAKAYKEYQEALREYRQALKVYKADKTNQVVEPIKPELIHYYTQDSTVEALYKNFSTSPRGFILHSDELSSFFKSMNQYKKAGNDREHIQTIWNANKGKKDRASQDSLICQTGLSITGGIQPQELIRFFEDTHFDSGFVARFIFCLVEDKERLYQDSEIVDSHYWHDLIEYCYEIPLNFNRDEDIEPMHLKLSDTAKIAFAKFYDTYEKKRSFLSERARYFIPKYQKYFSRIASVLHCVECYEKELPEITDTLSQETTDNAISIIDYYTGQAMKMLSLYTKKEQLPEIDKRIIQAIHDLQDQVNNLGRLPYAVILKQVNSLLPDTMQLNGKNLGDKLKNDLKLKTIRKSGNWHLLFEESKPGLAALFKKLSPKNDKNSTYKTSPERPAMKDNTLKQDDIIDMT